MNVHEYNRNAWNLQSLDGCRWSTPYPDEVIERAKRGDWSVILTPNRAVPRDWFPAYPDLSGLKILALASGGGQQVPVFAAAGAEVDLPPRWHCRPCPCPCLRPPRSPYHRDPG